MISCFKPHLIILVVLFGCNNDSYIRTYKVYKQPLDTQRNQSLLDLGVSWDAPDSWLEYNSDSSMRLTSFQVPYYGYDSSKLDYGDLSIFEFGPNSGTDQENVNRWRDQIGLAPQSESEINSSAQEHTNAIGPYRIFKLINKSGSDTAFLCAIMPIDNRTVFLKLSISKIGIDKVEKEFIDFCQSFQVVEK